MFSTVVIFQILVVSLGGYVNFALEEPCPEKYYGSQKCYTYSYRIHNKNHHDSKKRVYFKKPWISFDDAKNKKELINQKS